MTLPDLGRFLRSSIRCQVNPGATQFPRAKCLLWEINPLEKTGSFTTDISNPSSFIPANSDVDYIPANSPWPYVQNWFLSVERELSTNTMVELAYTVITAWIVRYSGISIRRTRMRPAGRSAFRLAARFPHSAPSRGSIRWVTTTTMVFRLASNIASRTACIS
jgi:hypothetical protein